MDGLTLSHKATFDISSVRCSPWKGPLTMQTEGNSFSFYAQIVIDGATTICVGDTITLIAVGGGANATYLWSTGATTSSIKVSQAGVYGLTIKKGKGKWKCSAVATPVTITQYSLVTDLDFNGTVNILDYIVFLGKFNTPCPGCQEDFIADGFVDVQDYLRWVADIFKNCQ